MTPQERLGGGLWFLLESWTPATTINKVHAVLMTIVVMIMMVLMTMLVMIMMVMMTIVVDLTIANSHC